MKIVVMVDKSAGNDSVGSMWTETFLFDKATTLQKVFRELGYKNDLIKGNTIKETIRIQIGEEPENE